MTRRMWAVMTAVLVVMIAVFALVGVADGAKPCVGKGARACPGPTPAGTPSPTPTGTPTATPSPTPSPTPIATPPPVPRPVVTSDWPSDGVNVRIPVITAGISESGRQVIANELAAWSAIRNVDLFVAGYADQKHCEQLPPDDPDIREVEGFIVICAGTPATCALWGFTCDVMSAREWGVTDCLLKVYTGQITWTQYFAHDGCQPLNHAVFLFYGGFGDLDTSTPPVGVTCHEVAHALGAADGSGVQCVDFTPLPAPAGQCPSAADIQAFGDAYAVSDGYTIGRHVPQQVVGVSFCDYLLAGSKR